MCVHMFMYYYVHRQETFENFWFDIFLAALVNYHLVPNQITSEVAPAWSAQLHCIQLTAVKCCVLPWIWLCHQFLASQGCALNREKNWQGIRRNIEWGKPMKSKYCGFITKEILRRHIRYRPKIADAEESFMNLGSPCKDTACSTGLLPNSVLTHPPSPLKQTDALWQVFIAKNEQII